jgi:hypothetical protein
MPAMTATLFLAAGLCSAQLAAALAVPRGAGGQAWGAAGPYRGTAGAAARRVRAVHAAGQAAGRAALPACVPRQGGASRGGERWGDHQGKVGHGARMV